MSDPDISIQMMIPNLEVLYIFTINGMPFHSEIEPNKSIGHSFMICGLSVGKKVLPNFIPDRVNFIAAKAKTAPIYDSNYNSLMKNVPRFTEKIIKP